MAFGSESGAFGFGATSSFAPTCGGCICNKSPTTISPTSIFSTQPQASSWFTGPQTPSTIVFGPSKFPTPGDPQNTKSISATQTSTDKGPNATSSAATNGHNSLVNLLTSALFDQTSPFVIGFAGQFSPDTLVLCQLPTSASLTQTATPEHGHNTVPQKTQTSLESAVSANKISGQSTDGALKSENPSSRRSFGFDCIPASETAPPSKTVFTPFGTAREEHF